jgi:1A family penicillin-binding protein
MSPARKPERRRRRFSPLLFLWRLFLAFVKLTLLAGLLLVLAGLLIYREYAQNLPDPQQIGQHRSFETTRLYARDGQTLLYELVDPQAGHRTVVAFDRIPRMLKEATIAVEDAGFYENPGVDLRGIVRAVWLNYRHQEIVSGGSTITQQLVRNILLSPTERAEISYERKLREAILAYQVSQEYSKDQILSIYLNEVYYGAQAYGVGAAARQYFGKNVWELTAAEATLLAGLPQSPTTFNPFTNLEGAKQRQRITLDLMVKYGYLTPQRAEAIFAEPVALVSPMTDIVAPHFVFHVRDMLEERYGPDLLYRGGLRVTTSIDLHWQAEAQRIARQHIAEGVNGNPPLRTRNAHNAAVVMLAPDGQVLALVGSIDYNSPEIDGEVNVALAPRQPGSALKPIVYAAALQRGWTPATVIWDEPTSFPQGNGTEYTPMNYDNSWHGPQRVRMALANSLNIPAVKALEFVGVEPFVDLATSMGITTFDDPSRHGLAMALGSNEVRLLDLSAAYNTLRNGGRYQPPTTILKVTNSRGEMLERWTPGPGRQVLGNQGEQIAFLITNILSDNQARWYMFGRGNVMELPDGRPAAAKTGTSNDWRDSWALGYTPEVTIGVWVGNNDNAPMQEIAGANGAGEIWQDLMLTYHQDRPHQPFPRPPGVVEQTVCGDTGGVASDACPRPITELFVAGSEPRDTDVVYRSVRVGGDGGCLAASYTPPGQVREVTFAVYPPRFQEWAQRNGIPQPPTQPCPPPQPSSDAAVAALAPVSENGVVPRQQVFVNGTARFAFTLEVGAGADPQAWQPVSRGIGGEESRLLGVWQADTFEPGEYTLRLRVVTPEGLPVEATQVVRVE